MSVEEVADWLGVSKWTLYHQRPDGDGPPHLKICGRRRYRGTDGVERSKSFKRKMDAESWAATQTASIAKGEWVDPHESRITFVEWVTQWELGLQHLRPGSRQLNVGVGGCRTRRSVGT